jgi:fructokinase
MFLVCGEAVIDMFQQPDSFAFTGQVAGSPLNVAVGLARLECPASFMTGLSRDPFGTRIMAALDQENVRYDLAQRTDRPSILSFIMVKPDGGPEYAFYGQNGADFDVYLEAIPAELPKTIRAIHVAGFPMAIEPSKTAYAGLVKREASQRFVSLDPNIRTALMGNMDVFRDHFESLAGSAALIKASTEDIELLYPGVQVESVGSRNVEAQSIGALTIAKRWRTLGCGTIVITDGAKGAFALNEHGIIQSSTRPVAVVDAVGAGDSFMSALLAGLEDKDLLDKSRLARAPSTIVKQIMDQANTAAGITCTRRGANPPTRAELQAFSQR